MSARIKAVQSALNAKGFDAGPADGIIGPRTIGALRSFQAHHGFVVTGIIDRATSKALFGRAKPASGSVHAPWMDRIEHVKGLHERRNRSALMAWLRSDGQTLGDPAKLPWCGDAVQTAIALTVPGEAIPDNPYLAANWMKFGVPCKPSYGAVLVFWRGSPSSWKGHVGFYVGEDRTHFHVLGGNQSNAITVTRIAKNRLRRNGSRWPFSVPHLTKPVTMSSKGVPVTVNEA